MVPSLLSPLCPRPASWPRRQLPCRLLSLLSSSSLLLTDGGARLAAVVGDEERVASHAVSPRVLAHPSPSHCTALLSPQLLAEPQSTRSPAPLAPCNDGRAQRGRSRTPRWQRDTPPPPPPQPPLALFCTAEAFQAHDALVYRRHLLSALELLSLRSLHPRLLLRRRPPAAPSPAPLLRHRAPSPSTSCSTPSDATQPSHRLPLLLTLLLPPSSLLRWHCQSDPAGSIRSPAHIPAHLADGALQPALRVLHA